MTHTTHDLDPLQPPLGEKEFLSDYSARDAVWDIRKALADQVSEIYARVAEYEKLSQRIQQCSGLLLFNWQKDQETGKSRLRLRGAQFCRVRYCSICQWRRSLMLQARFFEALPQIVSQFPTARWVFLTLTLKNCPIDELGITLVHMNKSWKRFIERKDLSSVLGWVRTTEVTRAKDGKAHPHFHTLMMVPSSWFRDKYIKQSQFVELWQESLRVDYKPIVDIRNVKAKFSSDPSSQFSKEMQGAVAETIKYSTKSKHMIEDPDWLIELTKQTHKKRFVATGGALKEIFKVEDEETNEDLLLLGDENGDDGKRIAFGWEKEPRKYRRNKKFDMT